MRVIRRSDGTLEVGRALPGRGAWLCPTETCVDLAVKRKAFERAFRQELAAGAGEALRARMDIRYLEGA